MYDRSIVNNRENYIYFLKYFYCYCDTGSSIQIERVYHDRISDPGLKAVFEKYQPDRIVKGLQGLDVALKLMEWSFTQLLYEKEEKYTGRYFTVDILDYSHANRSAVNCLCHATVLTELLLALGYKARKVYCLSCDVMPGENHVVVEVFIPDLQKWVFFDPTISGYMEGTGHIPLSIREIREALVKDELLHICYYSRFLRLNTTMLPFTFSERDYFTYLYKDFFRFLICESQHSALLQAQDRYHMLVPKDYLHPGDEIYNYAGHSCKAILTANEHTFWG